jgi:2-iminoacetate synthase ThiH
MMTKEQALDFFEGDDLIALGMGADGVRKRHHPEGLVSYSMQATADGGAQDGIVTLVFRAEESLEQIVRRLEAVRQQQEESGDIRAVMPRSEGTAMEHLKVVALTRIYLDNVPHVQASWQSGLKVGQVALRFGANDINGAEAGSLRATEEDIRRIIRDAGFVPKQRDALFTTYSLS